MLHVVVLKKDTLQIVEYHLDGPVGGIPQSSIIASSEDHAKVLRNIALKYQAGIGYDYEAALELCRKKARRRSKDDDVGGEALEMGYRSALRKKKADVENSGKPEK